MRNRAMAALLLSALSVAAEWQKAMPGYRYSFPRDYFNHPDLRTEWWYYTGNLRSADGRRFGYELTFFRHGLQQEAPANVWDIRDVWFAHLAVSDINGRRFFHTERMNRAGAGLAGVEPGLIWNGNWEVRWTLDARAPAQFSSKRLQAVAEKMRLDLTMRSAKPAVVHGTNGVSQKSAGAGRASYYVSLTRLETRGTLEVDGRKFEVEGLSWMDHEFFTHSLESNQAGWDWFSLQFDDGSDLMLYRLRRKDGSVEPFSSGTYVDAAGRTRHLTLSDFELIPGRTWTSAETRASYPVEWTVRVKPLSLELRIAPTMDAQELAGRSKSSPVYWEGAVTIDGTKRGRGYLEMTGYAGALRMGE